MQNEARLKMLLQSVTVLERHPCSSARSLRRVGHRRRVRAPRCRRILRCQFCNAVSVRYQKNKAWRKEMYPNTSSFSIRLIFADSHNTTQKQYLASVKDCSSTHQREAHKKLLAIWNLLVVQLYRAEFPPFWVLLQGTATLWAVPSRVFSWIGLRL